MNVGTFKELVNKLREILTAEYGCPSPSIMTSIRLAVINSLLHPKVYDENGDETKSMKVDPKLILDRPGKLVEDEKGA